MVFVSPVRTSSTWSALCMNKRANGRVLFITELAIIKINRWILSKQICQTEIK